MPRLAEEKLVEYELPSSTPEEPSKITINIRVTGDVVFASKSMTEGPGTFNLLAKQIKKWDYTAEDGKPAPITPETVAEMDFRDLEFVSKIVSREIENAIQNATQAVSHDEKKS